jgi:hypothetical protein
MDKLTALRHYSAAYFANATQARTYRLAREWMETIDFRTMTRGQLEQHATQAGQWASIGMLPAEATPLIAWGMTPEMVVAADPATDQERMERLADRMRMLD